METITAIDELQQEIHRRLADATITVDAPSSESGSWWLDVRRLGRMASIEWRPGRGFGVSGEGGGYGEGPDVVVNDPVSAAAQVARVLTS